MRKIYFSLGTNLGNRKFYITEMEKHLKKILFPPFEVSKLMETEPIGVCENQQWFFNRIFVGQYNDSPDTLRGLCQDIEKKLGRTEKNTLKPRTSDIDIIFIENTVISNEKLIIPHNQLLQRRFCIEGMNEIAPDQIHPIENKSFREIYNDMTLEIKKQRIKFIDN